MRRRRRGPYPPGPERDSRRQYAVFALLGGSLIGAGILIGVLGDDPAPVLTAATPAATADASPPPVGRGVDEDGD